MYSKEITLIRLGGTKLKYSYTGKTGPQYGSFISTLFLGYFFHTTKTFPYYGIGNYRNWIFQPFSTIFSKCFHILWKNFNFPSVIIKNTGGGYLLTNVSPVFSQSNLTPKNAREN